MTVLHPAVFGVLLATTLALPPAQAAAVKAPAAAPGQTSSVELGAQIALSEGKSTLMHLPFPAARLAVGNARVADVILINPNEVYLLGKTTGTTNLIVWNKANQATIIDIVVGLDTVALRQQFDQLFPTEKEIRITVSGGAVILTGTVADSVRAAQIVSVTSAYLQRNSSTGANGAAPAAAAGAAAAAA
ncbi:pilus assembly protein N-terminal domain-containing protein, partial [Duganella levis]